MKKLRILAALTVLVLSLAVYAPIAFAQSVPMLFTGTATVDGSPVASGATIEAYSAAGALVGTATTGASGQAANAFTMTVNNPALEDTQIYFYVVLLSGARSPAAGVQAKYDTVGGPGRATVAIAAVSGVQPSGGMALSGVVTFNGAAVAAGTTVECWSPDPGAVKVGTTTTTGTTGAYTMTIADITPTLVSHDVTCYAILSGQKNPAAGVKVTFAAGPKTQNIAAVTQATPGPVGDIMFSSTLLAGMIGGGLLLLATGGMMLRRKHSA